SPPPLRASPPSRIATLVRMPATSVQRPPVPRPPRIVSTRGRRCQVDTSTHFCPNPDCAYRGWVGWGNIRANGHPSGGPWRQLLCSVCRHYFFETLGTLFHGKHTSVELIVYVIGCLAEGLGIRGTARVFEVDPPMKQKVGTSGSGTILEKGRMPPQPSSPLWCWAYTARRNSPGPRATKR